MSDKLRGIKKAAIEKLTKLTPIQRVFGVSIGFHVLLLVLAGGYTVFQYAKSDEADFEAPAMVEQSIEKKEFKVRLKKQNRASSASTIQSISVETDSDFKVPKINVEVSMPTRSRFGMRGQGGGKGLGLGAGMGVGMGFQGFMGIKPTGQELVFVLDVSSSMRGEQFKQMAEEVETSLASMSTGMYFNIVVFYSGTNSFKGTGLVHATSANISSGIKWMWEQDPVKTKTKGTNPTKGLEVAFGMKPRDIILLSDGAPSRGVTEKGKILEKIQRWQDAQLNPVKISTISFFADPKATDLMKAIAKQNNGQFKKRG